MGFELSWLKALSSEVTRAWRRLLRAVGFSVSIVALIGVGVGGIAAVVTAAWSLYASPLPYQQSEQLGVVSVWLEGPASYRGFSEALVEELDGDGRFGKFGIVGQPLGIQIDGEWHRGGQIDHRLLDILRVSPVAGRAFSEDDVRQTVDPVALISERLWNSRFGNDPDILNRPLDFGGRTARIVGVLPEYFSMPESSTDVWLPMNLGPEAVSPDRLPYLRSHTVIVRMDTEFSASAYGEQLASRLRNDERLNSLWRDNRHVMVRPLRSLWSDGQEKGLIVLAASTGVVLLAAWMNLSALWLARWTGRDRELAIQFAMGAGRWMASLAVFAEYCLLAIPGLLLSIAVASSCIEGMYALQVLSDNGPLHTGVRVPTIGAALILLVLGVFPVLGAVAWNSRRISRSAVQFLGGKGISASSNGSRIRNTLLVGQVGIAFSLLIALGLLLGSWLKLLNEDLGFDSHRLVAAMVSVPDDATARIEAVVDQIAALPGVESVSWADAVPFGYMDFVSGTTLDDRPGEEVETRTRAVGPDFFQVAGIELLSGRSFGVEDAGSEVRTVIVNEAFERQYLNGSAIGRRIGYPEADQTVVGVVDSVHHNAPDEGSDLPTAYFFSPSPRPRVQLLVRTALDPEALTSSIRGVLDESVGSDYVNFVESIDSIVRQTVSDREPELILISTFSGLALVLVFYGVYALQSYRVQASTSEIGLRRAVGATPVNIIAAELIRSARILPVGFLLGIVGTFFWYRLIEDTLYEFGYSDPVLWIGAAGAIAITSLLASMVPAIRASRVQPLEALRYE